MPEVPDIDIERLGEADNQEKDVEGDANRDGEVPYGCGKGERRSGRPADVDDVEAGARPFGKRLADRAPLLAQQPDREEDADEGNGTRQAAPKRPVPAEAQNEAQDHDHDRKDDQGPQGIEEIADLFEDGFHR